MTTKFESLNEEIISCRKCPRLVEWREEVANDDTLQGYWAWVVSKLNEE